MKHLPIVLSAILLTGCTAQTIEPLPTQTPTAAPVAAPVIPEPRVITYATVGDSITAGDSWAESVPDTTTLDFVRDGGWAQGGAQIAAMAEGTVPVTADVIIIMAGTNDCGSWYWGTPIPERLASLDTIVVKSQATRVLISTVAPRSLIGPLAGGPEWVTEWNAALEAHAALRGWDFVDPWAALHAADGSWLDASLTTDYVHPTPVAADMVGAVIGEYLVGMFE